MQGTGIVESAMKCILSEPFLLASSGDAEYSAA